MMALSTRNASSHSAMISTIALPMHSTSYWLIPVSAALGRCTARLSAGAPRAGLTICRLNASPAGRILAVRRAAAYVDAWKERSDDPRSCPCRHSRPVCAGAAIRLLEDARLDLVGACGAVVRLEGIVRLAG